MFQATGKSTLTSGGALHSPVLAMAAKGGKARGAADRPAPTPDKKDGR